jgi:hypothetical protein
MRIMNRGFSLATRLKMLSSTMWEESSKFKTEEDLRESRRKVQNQNPVYSRIRTIMERKMISLTS